MKRKLATLVLLPIFVINMFSGNIAVMADEFESGEPTTATTVVEEPQPGKVSYEERKAQQRQIRKAEKAVEDSERRISDMERRLKELDNLFMDPEKASDMQLVTEYTSTKQALDAEVERWERLSEALDQLS